MCYVGASKKSRRRMGSSEDFDNFLESCSFKSVPSKHWSEQFMKPVMLMLIYFHAESPGDLALHQYACQKMMSYGSQSH